MYYFIGSVLYDCGVVDLMKKVEIRYPQLNLSAKRNDGGKIDATYVSNRFDPSGKLIEQVTTLNGINTNNSIEKILIDLNKIEFENLEIFISRQEKIVEIYKNKGKVEQLRIVSDSLELLFEFRVKFENWFDKMEYSV
jgi:hypothetical protein